MRNTFTLILTLFICNILCAQIPTQTIRGRVVDSESQYPLVGVKLEIKLDDVSSVRALTDTEGNFEFSKIPVGKYQVVALYAMYENKTVTAELSSGKELNVGEVVAPDIAEKITVISTMSTNGAVAILDEGTSITSGVKKINFVGASVTATNSGDDVTVNVSAGTGTVTSVAALTLGTTGTDLSSTVAIDLSQNVFGCNKLVCLLLAVLR